jgi:hypothetical protein
MTMPIKVSILTAAGIFVTNIVGNLAIPPAYGQSPTVFLQDSTITGADGTLIISELPFLFNGKVLYDDVTIPFSVGAKGTLTVGKASITKSVMPITSNFAAGTYNIPGKPKYAAIQVTGPAVGTGGSTVWSLAALAPNGETPLVSGQWTVGPLSDDPDVQAYIKKYKISIDPNDSYGLASIPNGEIVLIALQQVNDTIGVRGYFESSTPYLTLTYTMVSPS